MITLRDYQQNSIAMLFDWFKNNKEGHPCIVLPTGAGKSIIVAELCRIALTQWSGTRILMLTHNKELIDQNAEKMRLIWPNAPIGVYCAGLGRKEIEQITFGSIQSLRRKAEALGHIDLVIVDECHLISHRDEGGYRKLINQLTETNPKLRVVGFTATPFRLGHGLITDGDALFNDLIQPITMLELIERGYLAPLQSKPTKMELDTAGVKKRGGEFIAKDLQTAVDTEDQNREAVAEVIRLANGRKAWLFFCTGVDHAVHVRDILRENNIIAETVTGDTPKLERDRILSEFKAGRIQAVTNCGVLTTGFDYPDIDLIAMLRPTESKSLYIQMAGRGMRLKSHTDHCLVLDFAGVVSRHGPITSITVQKAGRDSKKAEKEQEPPTKNCEFCNEINTTSSRVCTACGELFPAPAIKPLKLDTQHDIMGLKPTNTAIMEWNWRTKRSHNSGKEMVVIRYYTANLAAEPIKEYLTLGYEGFAGARALRIFNDMLKVYDSSAAEMASLDLESICEMMNQLPPPVSIEYFKKGKFYEIKKRLFKEKINV